ncbi:hypothetical protein Bca52824_018165 [Brassica carinata]|uniref:Uncharacterized protein n=1 Tax=Brassica carinata TaxID=52824 RepID=A0A8X7VPY5_BRACI|nr:hypothetical protein Bca52824_018165 [Brassica carinata]
MVPDHHLLRQIYTNHQPQSTSAASMVSTSMPRKDLFLYSNLSLIASVTSTINYLTNPLQLHPPFPCPHLFHRQILAVLSSHFPRPSLPSAPHNQSQPTSHTNHSLLHRESPRPHLLHCQILVVLYSHYLRPPPPSAPHKSPHNPPAIQSTSVAFTVSSSMPPKYLLLYSKLSRMASVSSAINHLTNPTSVASTVSSS